MSTDVDSTTNGSSPFVVGGQPSVEEDLEVRELALETNFSSLQMQMSEMHSKLYEIQELRHSMPAPSSSDSTTAEQSPLDRLLLDLDTVLTDVSGALPTVRAEVTDMGTHYPCEAGLQDRLRSLEGQFEELVDDVEEVKEELKEDRWLGQFRSTANSASDMMASLEKAMVHIQDLVNSVRLLQQPPHGGIEAWRNPDSIPEMSLSTFEKSLKSYEAKEKFYRPSVDKSLSILDKGARDRVTRNGEALRRHADMLFRWQTLTDRMAALETDTTSAHMWLLARNSPVAQQRLAHLPRGASGDVSYYGLSTGTASTPPDDVSSDGSRQTSLSGQLKTPPLDAKTRRSSVASSLSRSMSPFGRMLGKVGNLSLKSSSKKRPPSDSSSLAGSTSSPHIASRFSDVGKKPLPTTPRQPVKWTTNPSSAQVKPRWNASTTKLEDIPSPPPRVIQRQASNQTLSRSVGSLASSSRQLPLSMSPSASQSYLPPRYSTPTPPERSSSRNHVRPPTPSLIPRPQSRNATSPTASNRIPRSASRNDVTPSRLPRPPSRNDNGYDHPNTYPRPSSSISNFSYGSATSPISPSRPTHRMSKSSSMSLLPGEDPSSRLLQLPPPPHARPRTPSSPFSRSQARTPEPGFRASSPLSTPSRPSLPNSASRSQLSSSSSATNLTPPSSFRHSPIPSVPRSSSRQSLNRSESAQALPVGPPPLPYKPNRFNLLDLELARIVNSTPNAMSVERVDPLPRGQAAASADLNTAQYRFISPRGDEKVYSCKALELHRGRHVSSTSGDGKVVKVMVRIGGGWLDLEIHLTKLFAF